MPSKWVDTTLGDACHSDGGNIQTGPFGSQLHQSDYVSKGIPFLMPVNIGDNRVISEDVKRITPEDRKRLSRYRLRKGDILYSRRGDVERRALIREEEDDWVCGSGCLRVRFNDGKIDPAFASYQLGGPLAREWIVRHAVGATMPNLNTQILSNVPFSLPPLPEQKAIAHILGSLDDKIELNRRMNVTLEGMAQALFKSWFVDFADRENLKSKISQLIMDGSIVIGDGYRAKRSELNDTGLPFARAGNINNGFRFENAELLGYEGVQKAKHKVSSSGDIVFTSKGTVGRFAFVAPTTPEFVFSPQLCFWRSKDHQVLHPLYLYFWMQSPAFLEQVNAVKGNSDMADYVSLLEQKKMKLTVPPQEAQQSLTKSLIPIQQKIVANIGESATLTKLRDTLLPKLISGELRIPEAEQQIEEALA